MGAGAWSDPGYEAIARLVQERTGLSFAPSRCANAELGIRRTMTKMGVRDLVRFGELLESDALVLDELVVELTVGETYFFRDAAQFELVRRNVVPEIQRRIGVEHVLRAWSAGCSSGEEPYSLAILFKEVGLADRSHILATDISSAALAKARSATYTSWSSRGEGATAAQPYLRRDGDRYVLDESVRQGVSFERLNLATDVYPSFATATWGMDLILCRNVLIYFDAATVQNVARRLFESLTPGGWLITGASDPPLSDLAPFATVLTDAGVVYRREPTESATEVLREAGIHRLEDARARASSEPQNRQYFESEIASSSPRIAPAAPVVPITPASTVVDPIAEARESLLRADFLRAIDLTRNLPKNATACAIHVQALAKLDTAAADRVCAKSADQHPLSAELHFLRAVLLMDLERPVEAVQAMRRAIYVDRSLAIAHFILGSILRSQGDLAGARRAYRNARDLAAARPVDETLALGDGERAGRLADAAATQLVMLESGRDARIPETRGERRSTC